MKNKYCLSKNLTNEASVEQFFLNRLLQDFDFKDSEIIPKTQIKSVVVSLGSKKVPYTPDYILKLKVHVFTVFGYAYVVKEYGYPI
jgi:type I restriction enzyme M protein